MKMMTTDLQTIPGTPGKAAPNPQKSKFVPVCEISCDGDAFKALIRPP